VAKEKMAEGGLVFQSSFDSGYVEWQGRGKRFDANPIFFCRNHEFALSSLSLVTEANYFPLAEGMMVGEGAKERDVSLEMQEILQEDLWVSYAAKNQNPPTRQLLGWKSFTGYRIVYCREFVEAVKDRDLRGKGMDSSLEMLLVKGSVGSCDDDGACTRKATERLSEPSEWRKGEISKGVGSVNQYEVNGSVEPQVLKGVVENVDVAGVG
jgi:hypothetical protein